MCKYCKRLKELNELDKNSLQKCINRWKRRDFKARAIISQLICAVQFKYNSGDVESLLHEAVDFVHFDWIGK